MCSARTAAATKVWFRYQSKDPSFRWMANVPKPTDGAARNGQALAVQLAPDLVGAVDLQVLVEHPRMSAWSCVRPVRPAHDELAPCRMTHSPALHPNCPQGQRTLPRPPMRSASNCAKVHGLLRAMRSSLPDRRSLSRQENFE
jgi:hypothetical protein